MGATIWPLFGLRVVTPRLELRYPDDELIHELARLTAEPIHDPDFMPFSVPWTEAPRDVLPRNSLQHLWGRRSAWTAEEWNCPMAVLVGGTVVGVQDIFATRYATRRVVETGSWLTQSRQGQGIGKEMRTAVLHLGFEGLGADYARTSAWADNQRSLGVTRAVGYEPNGFSIDVRGEAACRMEHFVMTRARWQERRRDDITIEGLEPCLPLFGL